MLQTSEASNTHEQTFHRSNNRRPAGFALVRNCTNFHAALSITTSPSQHQASLYFHARSTETDMFLHTGSTHARRPRACPHTQTTGRMWSTLPRDTNKAMRFRRVGRRTRAHAPREHLHWAPYGRAGPPPQGTACIQASPRGTPAGPRGDPRGPPMRLRTPRYAAPLLPCHTHCPLDHPRHNLRPENRSPAAPSGGRPGAGPLPGPLPPRAPH